MKTRDVMALIILGCIIWSAGTIYYAYAGPLTLETTSFRYWTSFIISPVVSWMVCMAILRRLRIPRGNWAVAMLLLAVPGMVGEAIVLTNWSTFMPKLHAASAGRYGAFLFITYAVVLSFAEVVTLSEMLLFADLRRTDHDR